MKLAMLPIFALRLRILQSSCNPLAIVSGILCIACLAALGWLAHARGMLDRQQQLMLRVAALPAPVAPPAPLAVENGNLALFYSTLGERRYAEQQVKTLFEIASNAGLVLHSAEYKVGYEKDGRVYTYQINLPVKGSYPAIWKFAMEVLGAIPFASLDEISLRRDTIGEPAVEAHLRLTLYLSSASQGEKR